MSVKQIFNTSAELDYPKVLPTLDLDFANSKTLDPRITFTRASGGSYVGADGLIKYAGVNEPRFDHDPVTGESLGFLVEEARTNFTLYSGDFSHVSWDKTSTSVANTIDTTDVLGTNTAIKLLDKPSASGVTGHGLTSLNYLNGVGSLTVSPSTNYVFSFFAKKYQNRDISFQVATRNSSNTTVAVLLASFDLTTGATALNTAGGGLNQSSLSPVAYTIPYPNGWFRCVFSIITRSDSATLNDFGAYMVPNISSSYNYTGDGVSGIYFCAPQLEAGSFPTSYIPTEASSRTRAADVASITGTNFSSWYNANAGTLLAYQRSLAGQDAYQTATFGLSSNNSGAQFIAIEATNDYNRFYVYGNGATAVNNISAPVTPGTLTKDALAYANNDVAAVRNGGTVATDSSVGIPIASIDRASLGLMHGFGLQKQKTIARLTYYPVRLPDSQLQVLTS